jgi:uncharacterized protein involved in exopolysaccharide biosynthesis
MREFLAVIFRRRWLILGLFFTVTTTVLVLTLATPTMYSSSGRVLVNRGERESALTGRVQIRNDWEQDLMSEVAKVRSAEVLGRAHAVLVDRAKRTGGVAPKINSKRLDVTVVGKSNVVSIGYDDLDPQTAQEVCDALVSTFVDYRQERSPVQTDSLFALQLDSLRRQIAIKTTMREQVASRTGINDPQQQMGSWISRMNMMEQRRDEVAADLAAAQSAMKVMRELQKNPDIDLPTVLPSVGGETQPIESALMQIKRDIITQQGRIATLRERFRDDSPEVVNALETLSTLQALLRKEVNQRLELAQSRVDQLKARLVVHEGDVEDLRARLETLPGNQQVLEGLDAEIKTLRARNDEYVRARDQARITANVSPGVTVTLLNPADAAEPKNARDLVRLLLAPGFSLIVGVGLAFFIDGLDLTVRTAGQAEAYLELPVLATLPERRGRRG